LDEILESEITEKRALPPLLLLMIT